MNKQGFYDFPEADVALIDWRGKLARFPISGTTPNFLFVLTDNGTTAVSFEDAIVYTSKVNQYLIGERVSEKINGAGFGGLRLVK